MPLLNPLRAQDYQPPDDEARRQAEAADAAMAQSIDDGFDLWSATLDIAAIVAALAAGSQISIWRITELGRFTEAMQPAVTAISEVSNSVATATAADIVAAEAPAANVVPFPPAMPRPPAVIPMTYDPIASNVVDMQRGLQSKFMQRLADTVEAVVDADIRNGLRDGMSPDEIARTIRSTIGLTDRQAAAVQNFRRLLETGDRAALDRVLRDRRFDASVRRAIEGQALDTEKIDRMVARYAERYQAHRAEMIARTETLRAANAGRRAAWEQYADRRSLPASGIRRFWLTAADERVCLVCRSIPLMNPAGVALDEDYDSLGGQMTMPPDPHPNCRCTERYEVASLGLQRAA